MKTFREFLNEASLSRFYQHYQNKEPILFISADRSENDKTQNNKNFELLKRHIKLSGFGYNKIKGGYIENGKRIDSENSLVIYASHDQEQELLDLGMSLGKYFKQDSIMFIDNNNNVYWISTRNDSSIGSIGTKKKLGKFKTNQINDFFTKIGNKIFKFDELKESDIYYPSLREKQLSKWYYDHLIKDRDNIVEVWENKLEK